MDAPLNPAEEKAYRRLLLLVSVLLSSLREGGGSAPSGPMYAVVMGKFSLSEFNAAESVMLRAGFVTKAGHVLTLTKEGETKADTLIALGI